MSICNFLVKLFIKSKSSQAIDCTSSLTIEEIVAEHSANMNATEKCAYWYALSQNIFSLLGKIDITKFEITPGQFIATAIGYYPTLTDIKIADSKFFVTSLTELQELLTRDWTNLVPYVAEVSDCDEYAMRLYNHLCDYYGINSVIPVWGDSSQGYHAFNLAVVKDGGGQLIARLIEPQTDFIFTNDGPLGSYAPRSTAQELGIRKLEIRR